MALGHPLQVDLDVFEQRTLSQVRGERPQRGQFALVVGNVERDELPSLAEEVDAKAGAAKGTEVGRGTPQGPFELAPQQREGGLQHCLAKGGGGLAVAIAQMAAVRDE